MCLLLVSCQPSVLDSTVGETAEPTVSLTSSNASPDFTEQPAIVPESSTSTPAQAVQPFIPPTIALETAPVSLPAALIIESVADNQLPGFWILDDAGRLQWAASTSQVTDFDVSPDGKQVLYAEAGDIWMLDLASGQINNVTETPERIEAVPRWWADREGFTCGSKSRSEATDFSYGQPTYVGFDGEYQVLDDVRLSTVPIGGPDGETFAYAGSTEAGDVNFYLYREDQGREEVDLAAYGLEEQWVDGISWSPDGQRIGLVTLQPDAEAQRTHENIVVLDLNEGTARILKTFWMFGTGSHWQNAPQWSASGDWLVFTVDAAAEDMASPGEFSLWLTPRDREPQRISTDASDRILRGPPTISPNEQWIAAPADQGIVLVKVRTERTVLWPLPYPLYQVGWLTVNGEQE